MLNKNRNSISSRLNLPELISSVSSQTSISNFVAQTPKQNRIMMNFKKASNQLPLNNQQKENDFKASNLIASQNVPMKNKLPYKMITSQLPASCSNHPQKQSSFYIQSDESQYIYYCQKCAILVASQGFKVKKIESISQFIAQDPQSSLASSVRFSGMKEAKTVKKSTINQILKKQVKQKQLNSFLNSLQRIQSRIDKMHQVNEKEIIEYDDTAESQLYKTKQFFQSVHKILDNFQRYYIQQIQSKSLASKEPLQTINEQISNDIQTLDLMKQDICDAYDDIINQTTDQEFETVMNAYQQNMQQIQQNLEIKQRDRLTFLTSGRTTRQVSMQINSAEIINQIQNIVNTKNQLNRRLSIKSTKRRLSIAGSKIR